MLSLHCDPCSFWSRWFMVLDGISLKSAGILNCQDFSLYVLLSSCVCIHCIQYLLLVLWGLVGMHLWYGLSISSSCLNSISSSHEVLTTHPPACTWGKWCDQKLIIDLVWPYCSRHMRVFEYLLQLIVSFIHSHPYSLLSLVPSSPAVIGVAEGAVGVWIGGLMTNMLCGSFAPIKLTWWRSIGIFPSPIGLIKSADSWHLGIILPGSNLSTRLFKICIRLITLNYMCVYFVVRTTGAVSGIIFHPSFSIVPSLGTSSLISAASNWISCSGPVSTCFSWLYLSSTTYMYTFAYNVYRRHGFLSTPRN